MATCRHNPNSGSEGAFNVDFTNRSGGALAVGNVVMLDVANDQSVTTPNANQSPNRCGVVVDGGANLATVWVAQAGIALVNVNAATVRGDYLYTTNGTLLATPNAARVGGAVIGRALTATGGAGTVTAQIVME